MDKRQLIIESALKLFTENGLHATPTSAITKEAGVSAGILFHYFNTKDDLITNLYFDTKREFYLTAFSNLEEIKTNHGKFRLLWSNSWNWALDNPLKFSFLQQVDKTTYRQKLKDNPDIESVYQSAISFFQKEIDIEFLRSLPKEYLMTTAFGLVISLVNYLSENPSKRYDSLFIEQAWDSFIDCLKR